MSTDDLFLGKLVADYLVQYGSATRPQIDALLRDKVGGGITPSQARRRIAHLLTSMRLESRIEVDRPGRGGRWVLAGSEKDRDTGSARAVQGSTDPVQTGLDDG